MLLVRVRKLILGPFKSQLNPVGVMSADWVAKQIVNLARRDVRNIIVTINPVTFILFPFKEFLVANYFRFFYFIKSILVSDAIVYNRKHQWL